GRENGIQLVHGDIAAFFRDFDHLLDSVVGKVEQGTVGRALAFVLDLFLLFCRHVVFLSKRRKLSTGNCIPERSETRFHSRSNRDSCPSLNSRLTLTSSAYI